MATPSLAALSAAWHRDPATGVRLVAFGSSNTELFWHSQGRHSWPCWLACSLRAWVGKWVSLTNTGVCGENTRHLRGRLLRDVAPLAPTAVIVTIGGNDRASLTLEEYTADLTALVREIRALGALPILQSYYAFLEDEPAAGFTRYMEAKAAIARAEGAPLIDQYAWFKPWHLAEPDVYATIMQDPMHLNPTGNALMGTLATRAFGLPDPEYPDDLQEVIPTLLARMGQYATLPRAVTEGEWNGG